MSDEPGPGHRSGRAPAASGVDPRSGDASQRTDLAEDRTLLANERTYASWMRTGMAAVAVALGFRALLRDFEPAWVAKLVATVFAVAGAAIIWFAFRRACSIASGLESHEIRSLPLSRMRWLNYALVAAALAVAAVLWFV
jgi:putative membrane protein